MAETGTEGGKTETWTQADNADKIKKNIVGIAIELSEKVAYCSFVEAIETNAARCGVKFTQEEIKRVFDEAKKVLRFTPEVRLRVWESVKGCASQTRSIGCESERYEYVDGRLSKVSRLDTQEPVEGKGA